MGRKGDSSRSHCPLYTRNAHRHSHPLYIIVSTRYYTIKADFVNDCHERNE